MAFSTANLSVVAYALVRADGTSPEINSGVKTSLISNHEGVYIYHVVLPGNEDVSQASVLQQGQGDPETGHRKDLIFMTPTGSNPAPVKYSDIDEFTKEIVMLSDGPNGFAIVILRPTIPTPTDSDGVQNGPT